MKSLFLKLKTQILSALKQGWSPRKLCWSTAWGFTVGLFPIYGVTTATLGVIGYIWKLNHTIMQAFNYVVSPLKFLLILPYIRLGEWIFQPENPFRLSIPQFTRQFKQAPVETLNEFAMTFVHAMCGWLISVPLLMILSYFTMWVLLKTGKATRNQFQEARS
ncbi:DUF2062 domain-containing protein [Kiritimatiellota bacterium B12222]|nr:DUF2062 domain-containing protein [Kiritimatiellota bacterium B12222]